MATDTSTPYYKQSQPAFSSTAVSPSDSADLPAVSRGLYVGGAGTLVVRDAAANSLVTFAGVVAGSILPIGVRRVMSSNTTCTGIISLI